MTEKKLIDNIKHMSDEKVKVWVYTIGGHSSSGYIVDFGEDYIRIRPNWKEDCVDEYIPRNVIDKVFTFWKKE